VIKPLPRILFVLPSFAGGGAERVALTLMRGLDPDHFSPSLVVFDGQGPLRELVSGNTLVTDLKTPRLRNALFPLISAIREAGPDVVFSTLGYVNLALLAARSFLPKSTRIIVREANMPSLSLPNAPYSPLLRTAYRFFYRRADKVICTSDQMMGEMEREFAVPSSRLSILRNPVDEAALRNAATPIEREEGDGLRLVAAGRLSRQKGFDRLIRMMPVLGHSTRLTILGEGSELVSLKALTVKMNVVDQVHFTGFSRNPWPCFAGADAFVMASRWEGLPNAALEALACGTPVIATPQSGGIAEIAAASVPGAVNVAEPGKYFTDALASLSPSILSGSTARPSLLPEQYRVANVIASFQDILAHAP